MLHEFIDLDRVMVLMIPMDGQANGADQPSVLAVGINTDEGRVLPVRVAVVRFYEVFETLRELLYV